MRKIPQQMTPVGLLATILFFGTLGIGCFLFLSLTLMHQPLFPFQMDNLKWAKAWLIMTVVDYYGAAVPLCALVLASENSRIVAGAWIVAILLLGSPFACAWMIWRLFLHQTLRMHDGETLVLAELAAD